MKKELYKVFPRNFANEFYFDMLTKKEESNICNDCNSDVTKLNESDFIDLVKSFDRTVKFDDNNASEGYQIFEEEIEELKQQLEKEADEGRIEEITQRINDLNWVLEAGISEANDKDIKAFFDVYDIPGIYVSDDFDGFNSYLNSYYEYKDIGSKYSVEITQEAYDFMSRYFNH